MDIIGKMILLLKWVFGFWMLVNEWDREFDVSFVFFNVKVNDILVIGFVLE